MPCSISIKNRPDRAMELVLEMFRNTEPPGTLITPDTRLDHYGLGHEPTKRKAYHHYLSQKLASCECSLGNLRPNHFATPSIRTVADVAALVAVSIK
jgi:hypothetical protein